MSNWHFDSGDQYVVDTESRYPEFSDVQTNDYSLSMYQPNDYSLSMYQPKYVNTLEDKYQVEQQYHPAYYTCPPHRRRHRGVGPRGPLTGPRCPMTASTTPAPRPPLPTQTIDERERDKYSILHDPHEDEGRDLREEGSVSRGESRESFLSSGSGAITLTPNTLIIMFLFIVIIAMCFSYVTTMNSLVAQMREMERLLKK
jgi:hypothetical protein